MQTTTRITLPGPFRGVALDLDGTLVDTEPIWLAAKQLLYDRHGTVMEPRDHEAVFGRDDAFTAAYLQGRFGLGPEHRGAIRREYLDDVARRFRESVPIRPGATELLTALRAAGVPVALATNTSRMLVDIALRTTGFDAFLDAVATSDDADAKPAPGIYLEACRRLGLDPTTAVALEDSPAGITAAKAAGLTCIAVPSNEASDVSHADHVVGSLLDLLEQAPPARTATSPSAGPAGLPGEPSR